MYDQLNFRKGNAKNVASFTKKRCAHALSKITGHFCNCSNTNHDNNDNDTNDTNDTNDNNDNLARETPARNLSRKARGEGPGAPTPTRGPGPRPSARARARARARAKYPARIDHMMSSLNEATRLSVTPPFIRRKRKSFFSTFFYCLGQIPALRGGQSFRSPIRQEVVMLTYALFQYLLFH